ncbi:PTS system mannose/fructose/N-acetylgalactosamine-transporter subunit IIB [Niallia taxi]|uniref:PTS mannose/fructose/sorbose transporter subunit IIB n=1 Tax=Niallia taxi TaxID=2499688 RepID=A0A3S2UA50_9BACI|nr:PTS sugar transporter subunit IIB [Niallia taxi]RVT62760.1 PTS mannose/fructose/sorbose transporter subunit IIB [Niallia taxi]
MAIELVRVDDRLIHGQVVTTWVKQKQIEQILIINDHIRNDDVQKSVFDLMAPEGVIVRTFGVTEFSAIYKKTTIKRRTLLLLTTPIDALTLARETVKFDKLNLGGVKYSPERKQYTKSVSLTQQEVASLEDLAKMGVMVSVQMVPSDKEIPVADFLKEGGK